MNVLLTILGGAVGAGIVSGIFGVIMWKLNRKAAKEDRADENAKKAESARDKEMQEVKQAIASLIVANRTILYDRIKHLGNSYLRRGSVSSEELADLIEMHRVYHDELKGNGFLDTLMEKVKALPVKN